MRAMALPQGWEPAPGPQPPETGQSWLHRVRRPSDSAPFALKRLKNADHRQRRERFACEVATMIKLGEHGIALPPVVEHDLEAERPYFVMPWYEEGSLEASVQGHAFAGKPHEAVALLEGVTDELRKLHEAGVAHRDLKPANILLSDEDPLLADFGLCLPIDDDAGRLTATAEAIGSRFYIAPENESGINEDVDQRPADFYAFGKTTWALLAGRTPPARELQGSPQLRLHNLLGDPRFTNLDYLLDELLDTDPRSRLADWPTVIEELQALERLLLGRRTQPRQPVAIGDTVRLARRVAQLPSIRGPADKRAREQRLRQ